MDGLSGKWNALPDDDYTKYNTQEIAIKNGATMFISVEWIEFVNNKLYISESGSNKFNFDVEIAQGAYPAKHLVDLCKKDSNVYKDPFGRILVMDLKTLEIKPLVNGGISKIDSFFCFSSPDALTSVQLNNKYYLVISEDTHGDKNGKASNYVVSKEETYNELYFLDLSIQNPTLEDLKRFMMAPEGCETTGDMFTPNGKTMFVSIQHPSSFNPPPFNRSCVVAIQGFK
jgi:secreted PhoX family phosphatase